MKTKKLRKGPSYIRRASRAKTLRRCVVRAILKGVSAETHARKVFVRNARIAAIAIAEQERIARGSLVNAIETAKTKWQLFVERVAKFIARYVPNINFGVRRSFA